jgi:hypothetical protein
VPVDEQNRARAGSRLTIGLHARHVRVLDGGEIGPARLWVSYDDGETWRSVALESTGDDRYTGTIKHPAVSDTSGWVSLRAGVTDSIGGSLTQTAIRAYQLD